MHRDLHLHVLFLHSASSRCVRQGKPLCHPGTHRFHSTLGSGIGDMNLNTLILPPLKPRMVTLICHRASASQQSLISSSSRLGYLTNQHHWAHPRGDAGMLEDGRMCRAREWGRGESNQVLLRVFPGLGQGLWQSSVGAQSCKCSHKHQQRVAGGRELLLRPFFGYEPADLTLQVPSSPSCAILSVSDQN